MAKAKTEAAPAAETPTEAAPKSIINSKYRGKYTADQKDWLSKFLDTHATKTKTVKVKTADGEGTENKAVPDGVDTDKLHAVAKANGLDIDTLMSQSETHGYPGRARMTIGNQLRTIAKQRHGLMDASGKFHKVDADFIARRGAPETPTHDQHGKKIEKPKAPAADAAKAPAEAAA